MKKLFKAMIATTMAIALLAGCAPATPSEPASTPAPTQQAQVDNPPATTPEQPPADNTPAAKPYIAVISKGFQHQFWQTVMKGSEDAAAKYNVDITFEGPPSESDINIQVDMLNAALAKNPAAICLAALDTQAVLSQLNDTLAKNIPVVGFDSGVPDAPAGAIVSTASTNNYEAGKLAANSMFNEPGFNAKVKAATPDNPVTIAVQSQDATSASILGRTNGFIDAMLELCNGVFPGGVEVVGHDVFAKAASAPAAVTISVSVPPTTSATDAQAAAQNILQNSKNLIGYFCSNEASVGGILASTNDGLDLDRANGKYKDLIVVGFDAGSTQKLAVKNNYFYGSVTQDPYMIGYLAVELAYKAVNGQPVDEIADTGCKFYNSGNMDQPDISILLYD